MGIASFEPQEEEYVPSSREKSPIFRPLGHKSKKLRTLSFLQLLKFEKAKYPYFFNLWRRGRDTGLFSLDDGTYSSS